MKISRKGKSGVREIPTAQAGLLCGSHPWLPKARLFVVSGRTIGYWGWEAVDVDVEEKVMLQP